MARPIDPLKRERILQTAIELFVTRGYNDTTTTLIAKHTDMSSAHMYIYFENKRALLRSAIDTMMAEHTAEMMEMSRANKNTSATHYIDCCYKIIERIRPRSLFIMSIYVTPGFEDIFEGINLDYSGAFLEYLADWPSDAAHQVSRTLMALSDSYFLVGDLSRIKQAAVQVLTVAKGYVAESN